MKYFSQLALLMALIILPLFNQFSFADEKKEEKPKTLNEIWASTDLNDPKELAEKIKETELYLLKNKSYQLLNYKQQITSTISKIVQKVSQMPFSRDTDALLADYVILSINLMNPLTLNNIKFLALVQSHLVDIDTKEFSPKSGIVIVTADKMNTKCQLTLSIPDLSNPNQSYSLDRNQSSCIL